MNKFIIYLGIALFGFSLSGCGYTTKSQLPENIQRVHVLPVVNGIDLGTEITDKTPLKIYRPGMEVDLTNAIINRFIFDGNLKVTPLEKSDAVLTARLVDYRRDALRYSDGDDVQEYRVSIVMDAELKERVSQKVLWKEQITGDTTFFLAGARVASEDEAANRAVEDAARRVVERTIEYW